MNNSSVKWRLAPTPGGGWAGVIDIAVDSRAVAGGGRVAVVARGGDKATALGKAAVLSKRLMENPLVAAVMPPQAALAVKAISALSKSAAAGKLEEAVKQFGGPGIKRLGKALGGLF